MLTLMVGLAHARAIPLGNPVRTAETGLIELQAVGGAVTDPVDVVSACDSDEGSCSASAYDRSGTFRLNLRPVDVLGVWADFGWHVDALTGLNHRATVTTAPAAGLHLAWPGKGFRPALSVRGSLLTSQNTDTDDDTGEVEVTSEHRALQVDAALLGAWGASSGGVNVWAGPIAAVYDDHSVVDLETPTDVSIDLDSSLPVGLAIGGEAISDTIGSPWKPRSARVSTGLEFRLIDAWGVSAWMGLGW